VTYATRIATAVIVSLRPLL